MTDKELAQKLKELKSLKADKDWKERSRSFLFSKVESSVIDDNRESSLFKKIIRGPRSFFSAAGQQAWAVVLIVLIIAGGAFSTQAASRNARPGDSLYLARLLSEKAKVAVTFNKEEKAKLDMQLASNRAKDITEVLAELELSVPESENSRKKAEKLSESFKEEIETVKRNIEEIENIKMAGGPSGEDEEKREASETAEEEKEGVNEQEEATFGIGAASTAPEVRVTDSGKDEKGVQVYKQEDESGDRSEEEVAQEADISLDPVSSSAEKAEKEPVSASSSLNREEQESGNDSDIDNMLSGAQESVEAKDYDSAKQMLEAVDELMEYESDSKEGEVKSAVTGSSTQDDAESKEMTTATSSES